MEWEEVCPWSNCQPPRSQGKRVTKSSPHFHYIINRPHQPPQYEGTMVTLPYYDFLWSCILQSEEWINLLWHEVSTAGNTGFASDLWSVTAVDMFADLSNLEEFR